MANNVEITFKIEGIEYSIDQLNELADAAKNAGEEGEKGAKKAGESQGFFSKKLDEVKDKLKSVGAALGDLKGGFAAMSKGLAGVAKGFGLSGKAANVFGKVTASAIAATGIGLLVPLVLSLVNYFKNLEGGARSLQKVMNALGAIIMNAGKALKLLLSGDFAGAFNTMKNAVGGAVNATDSLFNAQKKLNDIQVKNATQTAKSTQIIEAQKKVLEDGTKSVNERLGALTKVTEETKKLAKAQEAEIRAALEVAKAQLTLTNNYQERRDMMKEIAQLEGELIQKQTEISNIEYDAEKVGREIRQQAAADRKAKAEERIKNEEEVAGALAQLRVDSLADETEKLKQSLALQKDAALKALKEKNASADQIAEATKLYDKMAEDQLNAHLTEQNKTVLEKQEASAEARKALTDQLTVDLIQGEEDKALKMLEIENQRRIDDLTKEGIYLENKADLQRWYDSEVAKINKAKADREKQEELDRLAATSAAAGELAEILGKETAFGKLAAITQATINTYLGASQVIADEKLPSFLKPIMVAALIAAGLKQVAAIGQVQEPAAPKFAQGGYVMGAPHSMGGVNVEAEGGEYIINKAAMSIPSVAAMAQRLNQMTSSPQSLQAESAPLKAYVIATDVTTAQEANSKIEKLARL